MVDNIIIKPKKLLQQIVENVKDKSKKLTNKLQKMPFVGKKIQTIIRQKYLLLMSLPFIIWVIIFKYVPLWGWYMAFTDYKPSKSFFEQKWIGFKNFELMFADDQFYTVLRNTLAMSIIGLLVGFTLPIFLAIILNEVRLKMFKKTMQTISYLPHFVAWTVVASIFYKILSTDGGVVNQVLVSLHIINEPVQWMSKPKLFWGIATVADLWKELGWNSIIFLAAIANVSPELYESAVIDGASRFRRIWHITLPCILPVVMVILIMSIGNLINIGFEKQYLMRNSLVTEYSDVIEIYILNMALKVGRFGFGTAVGIFKSFVSITLLLIANFIFKKFTNVKII